MPGGLEDHYIAAGVDYPIHGTMPGGLATRRANRGFEDVALQPDGHTIVVALQSSVVVSGQRDRTITELVEFDTAARETVHEYPYQFDDAATFTTTLGTRGRDLRISALIPLGPDRVVVQERTDTECRFYVVRLDPADPLISGTDKRLLVDLASVPGVPGKVEGAALKNKSQLVVISDNDFGFVPRAYAEGEVVEQTGVRTTLVEIALS